MKTASASYTGSFAWEFGTSLYMPKSPDVVGWRIVVRRVRRDRRGQVGRQVVVRRVRRDRRGEVARQVVFFVFVALGLGLRGLRVLERDRRRPPGPSLGRVPLGHDRVVAYELRHAVRAAPYR